MAIAVASKEDISSMVPLINSAYRGEESKRGWTTEADMVNGEIRTSENELERLMSNPAVTFLKYEETGVLVACVFLQQRDDKLYLGMLSVKPDQQAKGIGRKLIDAAEQLAKAKSLQAVIMRVIDRRTELIHWYERRGYSDTGLREAWENSVFGSAAVPIQFAVLEKTF
jgi:ribosomal protein S18 acetylase RimI-like enzyme